jgi:RNA polymerase-binding protein DksA
METTMSTHQYKQRLVTQEQELSARVERAMTSVREATDDSAHDVAEEGSAAELTDERLSEAEADRHILNQVRAALKRIDDGTFGQCAVDGAPIEAERLDAMPWTPLCLEHQQQEESAAARTSLR